MKRLLRSLLRIALVAVLAIVALLLLFQTRLMYFPRGRDAVRLHEAAQHHAQPLEWTTSAGRQSATYIPPAGSSAGVLPARLWVVCAGNGSLSLDLMADVLPWDPAAGFLFFDYPGYGGNEGKPSPASIRESAVAALTTLAASLHSTPTALAPRLGVIGHSLGSAAALIVAGEAGAKQAILFSPFTTMTEMGRRTVGWPLCLLNLHRYDNRARLDALDAAGARVLIIHGTEDEVIPVAMGRELAARHPQSTRFIEIPAAHHNDVLTAITDQVTRWLADEASAQGKK